MYTFSMDNMYMFYSFFFFLFIFIALCKNTEYYTVSRAPERPQLPHHSLAKSHKVK